MPVFWGSSCWRLPQPDFSATSLRTPIMRAASRSASAGLAEGLADGMRGALRRSRRNCTGSFPAACASSSVKDWNTQENALLRGARKAYVGTPRGISEAPKKKSCRKVPGNSLPGILAEGDRKSTRLNSSHGYISYAVFCLKKKKKTKKKNTVN